MKKFVSMLLLLGLNLLALENQYVYLGGDNYDYIDYLINSNQVKPHFVFLQPYRYREIIDSQDINKFFAGKPNGISVFTSLKDNYLIGDAGQKNLYSIGVGGHYISDKFILCNRSEINQFYKYDEYFPGDLSESDHWLYGRVNDAYMDIVFDRFSLFIGRMKRNWGGINFPSLILSDYPYNYDHVYFNYETDFLNFSLIYARLEDARSGIEYENQDSTFQNYTNVRKYIMGHRADFHICDNFQIAFSEFAIYGGENRNFELAYANPMTLYYGVQRNQKKGMSGLWAVDLFYKPLPKLTIYGQFLIDDIIVNNDPGVDDRAQYPDRFATMISLRSADCIIDAINISLSYVRVWNDTYQSGRSWENYHYEGLGLGYPTVSSEELHLKLDYFGFYPFYLSGKGIYGRYGSAAIDDVFFYVIRDFPVSPVNNNLYMNLKLSYIYNQKVKMKVIYEFLKDEKHYINRTKLLGNHNFTFSVEVLLEQKIGG